MWLRRKINKHAFIILITGNEMAFALRLELDVEWSNALQIVHIQNVYTGINYFSALL